MNYPTTFEDVVGDDYSRFLSLTAISERLKQSSTIQQSDVIAVEAICPSLLLKHRELRDFSVAPSEYNRDYALEKIDLSRLGFLGKMIKSIIDWIRRLFKGRKNDKDQPKQIKEQIDKVTEKAVDFDREVDEHNVLLDQMDVDLLTKGNLEVMRRHLQDLHIDPKLVSEWTKDWPAFRDAVFRTKEFRRAIYDAGFKGLFFNIIVDADYALIQDELGVLLQQLEPEAQRRVAYISTLLQVLTRSNVLLTGDADSMRSDMASLPYYNTDVGMIRQYVDMSDGRGADMEVLNRFAASMVDMFTATDRVKDDFLTNIKQLPNRYTDSLKNGLIAVAKYNEYYTKEGSHKLDLISAFLDNVQGANQLTPELRSELIVLLNDVVRVTSRMASTMTVIADRGAVLASNLQTGSVTLDRAMVSVAKITQAIYTEYGHVAGVEIDGRRKKMVIKTPGSRVKKTKSLESITSSLDRILRTTTVSRSDISDVYAVVEGLPSLESYTVIPTRVHYTVTVEGLREQAKAILKAIVDKIVELFERFKKWLVGSNRQADEMLARRERLFGKDVRGEYLLRLADDQRDYFTKLYELAAGDAAFLTLFRRAAYTAVIATQTSLDANLTKELERYHGDNLYDFIGEYATRGAYSIIEYQLLSKESAHTKGRVLVQQEFERRRQRTIEYINELTDCFKNDTDPRLIELDDEADNAFMREIVTTLAVPFAPKNIKGSNPGLTDGSDESILPQREATMQMVAESIQEDRADKHATGVTLAVLKACDWDGLLKQEAYERTVVPAYQDLSQLVRELSTKSQSARTHASPAQLHLLKVIASELTIVGTLSVCVTAYYTQSLALFLKQAKIKGLMHNCINEYARAVLSIPTLDATRVEQTKVLLSEYDELHKASNPVLDSVPKMFKEMGLSDLF